MIKWAIFFSGWGRTAGKLKNQFKEQTFDNAILDTIVGTGQSSPLLEQTTEHNYHIINSSPNNFPSRLDWQKELRSQLQRREINLIFLCGFKYRIHNVLLQAYPNRIVNIHPSLLPAFKNTQFAIQEAMELGVMITGITTHIIDEKIDEGIILCQHPINIENKDLTEIDSSFVNSCPGILENTVNKMMRKYVEYISKT